MMPQLQLSSDDLLDLRTCQIKERRDCLAAFTAIPTGEIWAFAAWGRTPHRWRENVRGLLPHLDRIADEYLTVRPEGGRFFVLRRNVIYRTEPGDADGIPFVDLHLQN